eukprot:COSAG03_NODE_2524_length_2675_cov_3968.193323_5_plen_59_part_00
MPAGIHVALQLNRYRALVEEHREAGASPYNRYDSTKDIALSVCVSLSVCLSVSLCVSV